MFISRALSPALVSSVKIEKAPSYGEKGKAIVTIPSDQKSKAIGKRHYLNNMNKIHIYDSVKKEKVEFKSIKEKVAKIYVCGPTVYDDSHLGHARSGILKK
uniref:Uncharacterized protein n=1 Tax=Hucho hucho TaxID=62062 RepID=A0A4W5LXZ5_9TELE